MVKAEKTTGYQIADHKGRVRRRSRRRWQRQRRQVIDRVRRRIRTGQQVIGLWITKEIRDVETLMIGQKFIHCAEEGLYWL